MPKADASAVPPDTRSTVLLFSICLAGMGIAVAGGQLFDDAAVTGRPIGLALIIAGAALAILRDGGTLAAPRPGLSVRPIVALLGGATVAALGAVAVAGGQGATGLGLLIAGVAIGLLGGTRTRRWAEAFGLATLALATFALLALLYGVQPGTHAWAAVPPAGVSGLMLLAGGVLAASPEGWAVRMLASPHLGGKLARRLLVPAIGIPIVFSLVRLELQREGWYGLELGLAAMLTATTVTLAAVIWWSARWLDRIAREREQALGAARASEERFRQLTALSSDWYWEQDARFRFTFVSDTGPDDEHMHPANPLGKTPSELAIDSAAADWDAHRATLEAHRPFRDFEYLALGADGAERWYSASGEPMFDSDGRFKGYRGVGREITARKRAEEALRLANRAIEASANGIMLTEAGTAGDLIVYVNPAFERITGYLAHEAVGRSPRFLHGDDTEQLGIDAIRAAVREGREGTAVLRNYRKDGTLFWNDLSVAPVRDEQNRLTHWVGVIEDVSARMRYEEELERQATHDALTGLANRSLLEDRMRQAMALAARTGRPLAVLVLDLDRFKRINDTHGHAAGDAVLRSIAARLAASVRGADTVARTGGDEFALVLVDLVRPEDAATVARKILETVAEPLAVGARALTLTTSIGISMFPTDGETAETLLQKADAAMYAAKRSGRNAIRAHAAP